jgi:hypothetical protein
MTDRLESVSNPARVDVVPGDLALVVDALQEGVRAGGVVNRCEDPLVVYEAMSMVVGIQIVADDQLVFRDAFGKGTIDGPWVVDWRKRCLVVQKTMGFVVRIKVVADDLPGIVDALRKCLDGSRRDAACREIDGGEAALVVKKAVGFAAAI